MAKVKESETKSNEFKGLTIDEIYHEISEQVYNIYLEKNQTERSNLK